MLLEGHIAVAKKNLPMEYYETSEVTAPDLLSPAGMFCEVISCTKTYGIV